MVARSRGSGNVDPASACRWADTRLERGAGARAPSDPDARSLRLNVLLATARLGRSLTAPWDSVEDHNDRGPDRTTGSGLSVFAAVSISSITARLLSRQTSPLWISRATHLDAARNWGSCESGARRRTQAITRPASVAGHRRDAAPARGRRRRGADQLPIRRGRPGDLPCRDGRGANAHRAGP